MPPTTDDRPFQYLIIGHVTKDIAPEGERMGGTAAYSGLTALAFGASPSLVTSCSSQCDLSPLDGILIHKVLAGSETVFENRYHGSIREQWVRSVAEALGAIHIPPGWRAPALVHLAPVVGEIKPEVMNLFAGSMRCATLQGWMRTWDSDGKVDYLIRPEAEAAAKAAHAVVFSMDDVQGDEQQAVRLAAFCPAAAVTDGARGCRVHWQGEVRVFPAPPLPVIDPTGAGDIFAAIFFLRLQETNDAWEAARMATALASRSVTRRGLTGVPTREEIQAEKQMGASR